MISKLLALLLLLPALTGHSAEIRSLAGTGQPGYSGDNGPAAQAQLNNPFGVVRGPDRALYVCDTGNHVIRRIDTQGVITTVAGAGKPCHAGDGGPARQALLHEPYEIRFDSQGHMFLVEMQNHLVRRVDAITGIITTLAGTGQPGFSGDNGPAIQATFRQPHSIQLDSQGNLFICDIGNHRLRQLNLQTGFLTTAGGTGERTSTPDGAPIRGTPLNGPRAIDFDGAGNLWLALREGNAVYRLDLAQGTLHHMAGTGRKGFTGHGGPARQATLSGPKGLSVGPDGNVYLADTESHSIRKINVGTGTLELVAGTGERGDGPDGDPLACKLARPHGVFVDADGRLFVGDSEAHRVRVLTP
jgi:streptogramin lyase